ncbi:hypothetical protein NVS55_17780 [Myxococcus stipitatus]|uniref:hypothetical protein n=1 Tax=Myxococcus stipitatus TaxID=83455 RepID=UPI003144FCB9
MGVTVRRPPSWVVSLLLWALAGCGGDVTSTQSPAAEIGESRSEIRIANSLSTDALVLNAIGTNGTATTLLATSSLDSLFDGTAFGGHPHISRQLHDPDARKFMEYLVSCALGPSQVLAYFDPTPSSGGPRLWGGKAGLCTKWLTSPPSQECLNRVSACLLSRNNALGRRVELSIRGEVQGAPSVFYLEPVTRPAEYDPSTAQKLASFATCAMGESGAQRNCGWTAHGIGRCTAGATVWAGAGGAVACPGASLGASAGSRMVLRVCSGVVGCNTGADTLLGEGDGSCAGTDPVVSFTCPAEGYYSVMTAPWDSADSGVASVATTSTAVQAYALSEAQVYGMREGAFYGNIFDRKALATEVYVEEQRYGDQLKYVVVGDQVEIQGAIYRKMYSCYDPSWVSGSAYSTHRVCALPNSGANCAATVTGPCWGTATNPQAGKCEVNDGTMVPGDGDYERCRDNLNRLWLEPVTTFLHESCGAVEGSDVPKLCERSRRVRGKY